MLSWHFLGTSYDLLNMSSIFYVFCAHLDSLYIMFTYIFCSFFVIRFTYLCLCSTFRILHFFFLKFEQKDLDRIARFAMGFHTQFTPLERLCESSYLSSIIPGGLMVCALSYTGAMCTAEMCNVAEQAICST